MIQSDRTLIIAAHPDDEVISMGGTIRRLSGSGTQVKVVFVSDGVTSRKNYRESLGARRESAIKALEILGCNQVIFGEFPDNLLDSVPELEITKFIEENLNSFNPDTVFTHHPDDLNIDHQRTSKSSVVACRPKPSSNINALFYFEVLSSTGWNFGSQDFRPNLYVEISAFMDYKLKALSEYRVELEKFPHARSLESIEALAIYRGNGMGMKMAEAFQVAFFRQLLSDV